MGVLHEVKSAFTAGAISGKRAPSITHFFAGTIILVKADLGTKRACPSCTARFYDLDKRPIECPKCGFSYEPEALFKQRRRQPEPAGVVRAEETEDEEADDDNEDGENESEEDEEEEAVVEAPLNVAATGEDEEEEETAEEEEPENAEGMSVVEGDDGADIEDIEVEDDEDEEDDDLLGEVEDEEDDVSGIIDPGIAKDEG
ncbi:MAG: TIGR02300 family protein [Alphaproteobacteria bacterium]|nr:TIGR02300 family protein [Alphaproteobacteria bacterium]